MKMTTQIHLEPILGLNGAVPSCHETSEWHGAVIQHWYLTFSFLSSSFLLCVLPLPVLSSDHASCCHWPLWCLFVLLRPTNRSRVTRGLVSGEYSSVGAQSD
jgi:hypothetical protein